MYSNIIKEQLVKLGRSEIDPRHVEGYMREVHRTLDNIDRATFNRQVKRAVKLIDKYGKDTAEAMANSFLGVRKPKIDAAWTVHRADGVFVQVQLTEEQARQLAKGGQETRMARWGEAFAEAVKGALL